MRDITWPRIKLNYRLTDANGEVKSGEENISDRSYLDAPHMHSAIDTMPYEKEMLERWFRSRFGQNQAAK